MAAVLPAPATRVVRDLRALARRTPAAFVYAVALSISNIIMAVLPASAQQAIIGSTSTNITHLALDPLFVLPASAFVDPGQGWLWVPLSLILIGGLERRFGSRRALIITFGAHALATLLSEGVLLARVVAHAAPFSEVHVDDVGPSYVLLAALAACLVIGARKLRIFAALTGVLLVPGLLVDLPELDMSSIGHLCALLFGAAFAFGFSDHAVWFSRSRRQEAAAAARRAAEAAKAATPSLPSFPSRPSPVPAKATS